MVAGRLLANFGRGGSATHMRKTHFRYTGMAQVHWNCLLGAQRVHHGLSFLLA
jgi:hypothetical protein